MHAFVCVYMYMYISTHTLAYMSLDLVQEESLEKDKASKLAVLLRALVN